MTLSAQQAPGQTEGTAEPVATLPRYYVEVLVFSNQGGTTSTSESFAPRSDPLTDMLAPGADRPGAELPIPEYTDRPAPPETARPDASAVPDEGEEAVEEEFRYELLEAKSLSLKDARDTLERLSAYTPLFHGGWVQEGYPEERAKPFDIAVIDSATPLVGTLTLHRSRFLHIRVDLEYLPAESSPTRLTQPLWSSSPTDSQGPRYQITEARRLRSGELHFFDHPAFGVLVQISPEPLPDVTEVDLTTLPQRRTPPATTTDQAS